ncbi:MAG: beta-propeller fold lactonase family protein [Myxococcales bacterium]|nr:beta-propeller fold lactonase family protein [Myxococcales bacterium]MCB9715813.1 beta-propeller fold lactonase family protein [Myxococcales bacterium]
MTKATTTALLLMASTLALGCFTDEPPETGGSDDSTGGQDGTTGGQDGTADESTGGPGETGEETTGGEDAGLLPGPTKGGAILANAAANTLAVANKATGDVTLFSLPDLQERARVSVGAEPVSVSWSPDDSTLYVVNRADGTVTEIQDAETEEPFVSATVAVGSEPIHGALSPRGRSLYVSSWVDGTLSVIDTGSMTVTDRIVLGGAPYAVCVTNDGDELEDDETVYVTDFYGRPVAGTRESEDGAREGRVFGVSTADLEVRESTLDPFPFSGVTNFEDTGFYPNQLYSCAVNDEHLYVTAVGASPADFGGTTDFHQNVQGMVGAISLATGEEARSRSINLNHLVDALPAPKRFVAVPADIAFAPNSDFGYVASTASNSLFRIDWTQSPPVGGSPSGATFLATDASPTAVTIVETTAYVYNEVGRSISVIDLAAQETVEQAIESAPQPTTAQEISELRGQRFFNTGLARWSANGWVSCLACHPAGLTDNVTWRFPAGPRQTVDLGGSFNEGGAVQRIFNWTAIFDEVHDFELNTRGVAGGTGAIVSSTELLDNGAANTAVQIDFVGPGGVGNPLNGFNIGSARSVALSGATPEDWDDITAYVASLRSPRAATELAGDPEAGRVVFEEAGCQNCHAGPLWTLSERYFTPQLDQDARGLTLLSQGVNSIGVRPDQVASTNPAEVFVLENDANGAPARHSCVVRIVGTFGVDGPDGHGATEIRQNGNAAQGVDGFNVPSLLGVSMGGPYLHNGAAETLEELLDPTGDFGNHLRAGNQVFSPTDDELADLIAFLRSIDDGTDLFEVPADQSFCPNGLSFD